jgi:Protein of unknown function (DUF3365)
MPRRALLLAVGLLTCGQAAPPGDPRLARGAAAIAPFKRELQAALQAGLVRGPAEAVDVCRVRAPELARAAALGGLELGRSSHKLRNPANAPRAWVKPLLDAYVADPASARPRATDLGAGRVGYVEPILVQPPCLACHGEALAEPVREQLHALYPEDRAVGFRTGDLRGLFWAELPAAE